MDSLDAQCLCLQLFDGKGQPPDLWHHHRSGALSWSYAGSKNVFTWPPEDVAKMARDWRKADASKLPERVRMFRDLHERFEELHRDAGLQQADVIIHDFGTLELRAIWGDEKVVVVVERVGELGERGLDPECSLID